MGNKEPQLACNACKVALEGPAEPKLDDVLTCPSCRLADTYQAVLSEISDHVHILVAEGLQRSMATAVKGNDALKFEKGKLPKPNRQRFTLI